MRFAMALLLAVVLCGGASAQSPSPTAALKQLGQRSKTYFRNPDPEAMLMLFGRLSPGDLPKLESRFVVAAFLSHLVTAHPQFGERLLKLAARAAPEVRETAVHALSFSNHPRRLELIRRLEDSQYVEGLPAAGLDFRTLPVTHPTHLDMLWASFSATGDGVFIHRVAAATEDFEPIEKLRELLASAGTDPDKNAQINRVLIAQAALWSLETNAGKLSEVRAALADFAARGRSRAAGYARMIVERHPAQ